MRRRLALCVSRLATDPMTCNYDSRTTPWRLHTLARIASFLSIKISRVAPRLAFEGQSPLPQIVIGQRFAGPLAVRSSLRLLVDQQPVMARQRNSFREVVKVYRFHDVAINSKSIAFDNVLFFAG